MANKKKWLGILVMVLVFGLPSVAYTQSGGGTFTLTDIPSKFNGNYVFLVSEYRNFQLVGTQNYNLTTHIATLPRIVNGRVSIPMWILFEDGRTGEFEIMRYNGNHTVELVFWIYNSVTLDVDSEVIDEFFFDSVRFSNGSAAKSFHDIVRLSPVTEWDIVGTWVSTDDRNNRVVFRRNGAAEHRFQNISTRWEWELSDDGRQIQITSFGFRDRPHIHGWEQIGLNPNGNLRFRGGNWRKSN